MNRKPLVVDPTAENPVEQLQLGDDLDIPLRQRVNQLEENQKQLAILLMAQGIEVPEQLIG